MHFLSVCRLMAGRLVFLFAAVLLFGGCTRTTPVAYYQLAAADDAGQAALDPAAIDAKVIGLGPVQLPERLDRPQIVTRIAANRLRISDRHRWVEPLAENMTAVVRENLSTLLKTERFRYYPWDRSEAVDYQLVIDVIRFEGDGHETATLEAVWSIHDGAGKILQPQRRSSYHATSTGTDYEGLVSALSEALGRFCREIAQELLALASAAKQEKP